jgi:hypothetical protein
VLSFGFELGAFFGEQVLQLFEVLRVAVGLYVDLFQAFGET